jgi:hypothetical protein
LAEGTLRALEAAGTSNPLVVAEYFKAISTILGHWSMLLTAASQYSSSVLVQPAVWLAPPLLQLLHVCLQAPSVPYLPKRGVLLSVMGPVATMGYTLSAHPVLHQAVTGRPGDVALGAVAAQALRQVRGEHSGQVYAVRHAPDCT